METKSWKEIKDTVYGVKGTERRDELERDFGSLKIKKFSKNTFYNIITMLCFKNKKL